LNDSAVLSSTSARPADRLVALKYLGHWVGDIHQPLHVSFQDDRGGNEISVTGECHGSLHSAWDKCLVFKAVGEDVSVAAAALVQGITPAMIEDWTSTKPHDWANESLAVSESMATHYCVKHQKSCDQTDEKLVTIDDQYIHISAPIVRERLQKAGVRLASVLDDLLDD
jgi:hypothetical protein